MIIIGVDPGIAKLGFGIISQILSSKSKNRNKIKCLDYGLIQTNPGLPVGERLKKINNELNKLINKYKPKIIAVEKLYFFKNLKTAIPVSEAKGVILLTAAKKKIKVWQFAPLEVKMGICGYGRANKKQVQRMVKEILNLKEMPRPDDAADGLAIAICCAQRTTFKGA